MAEKAAKNARRNKLYLTTLKRSGEHAGAPLPWGQVARFEELVAAFVRGASDGWSYRLRATLDELGTPFHGGSFHADAARTIIDIVDAEAARLIARSDLRDEDKRLFLNAWNSFSGRDTKDPNRTIETLRYAVTLIQSASFIARGREEARS